MLIISDYCRGIKSWIQFTPTDVNKQMFYSRFFVYNAVGLLPVFQGIANKEFDFITGIFCEVPQNFV